MSVAETEVGAQRATVAGMAAAAAAGMAVAPTDYSISTFEGDWDTAEMVISWQPEEWFDGVRPNP